MAQLQLQTPTPFNFQTPDDWNRWKNRFEQFRIASGLSEDPSQRQVSTSLYCMGEEAEAVLMSTNITADEKANYETVIGKFDGYFRVRKNVIFERARFNRRVQNEGESVEQFMMDLYHLAESCEYAGLKEEMIRDRLVVRIRDGPLSERLILDPELTLEKAKKQIRQRQAVREQTVVLKGEGEIRLLEEVHTQHVRQHNRRRAHIGKKRESQNTGTNKTKPAGKHCSRRGKEAHSKEKCPAKDVTCHRCKKRGHYSNQCFTKPIVAEISEEITLEGAYLDTIANCSQSSSHWITQLEICGKLVNFKLDTGAEVSAINEETHRKLEGIQQLEQNTKTLYGPSKHPLPVLGLFQEKISNGSKVVKRPIYVIKGIKSNLLGLPAITALDLVTRNDMSSDIDTVEKITQAQSKIYKQFPSVFSGLGKLGEEYTIRLGTGAKPHSLFTARQVPLPLKEKVKSELDKMEAMGVISKVDVPTPWCAGMVVVPKKDGNVRICVDLKSLNVNVLREVHPLPLVDEILAQLSGARVFSKLDANSGFWQIPLSEESRLLTTFITPHGRYCFNKLPFGISSAPELFQKRMGTLLEGLEGVICLIDDVLVYGKDKVEHDNRLNAALKRIQTAGVTLNKGKCEFERTKLIFLGHLLDHKGIQADPAKTAAICDMKPPNNVRELRCFIGMTNQLGKFSMNLAEYSQPLRALLSTKNVWTWDDTQETAFRKVKEEICKHTTLACYDPQAEMKIAADASSFGLGAVLLQKRESTWKAVSFASRSMSETERRYAQIEKEALASVWACERFSSYIIEKKFTIETDHKPLVPLLGTKQLDKLPPRVLRFRLRLDRFNYTIVHVPGKLLYTADTLSRAPLPTSDSDVPDALNEEAEALMEITVNQLPASKDRLNDYRRAQALDPICSMIIEYCLKECPDARSVNPEI